MKSNHYSRVYNFPLSCIIWIHVRYFLENEPRKCGGYVVLLLYPSEGQPLFYLKAENEKIRKDI